MRRSLVSLAAMAVAGCGTQPTVQKVEVAIPVACREPTPERPVMPTHGLTPGVPLTEFSKAAAAEIERREGYEARLRAALANCQAAPEAQ